MKLKTEENQGRSFAKRWVGDSILNSSTNSKRSELSIETVSRQKDKHPRLTNIVGLSNYVARIHSSPVTSNYQGTEAYNITPKPLGFEPYTFYKR